MPEIAEKETADFAPSMYQLQEKLQPEGLRANRSSEIGFVGQEDIVLAEGYLTVASSRCMAHGSLLSLRYATILPCQDSGTPLMPFPKLIIALLKGNRFFLKWLLLPLSCLLLA